MELGADAVLMNTAIAGAKDPIAMAEAMNLAVVLKVPAVFVIENNYYSEHTNISYAVGCDDLKARTEGFGFDVELLLLAQRDRKSVV